MSEYAKFFDSKDGDRKYNAQDFREWLRQLYPNGVAENGLFATVDEDARTITVGAGFVNINGYLNYQYVAGCAKTFEETTFEIPAAGNTDRIDAIIIEFNEEAKDITLRYQVGTDSAPTPVRTATVYQLIPAEISVRAGSTKITQADVTDTRMVKDLCGYIVRLIDSYDFTTILEQYSDYTDQFIQDNFDEFDEWFQSMRSNFTAETVALVTAKVTALKNQVDGYIDDVSDYVDEASSLHNRFNALVGGGGGGGQLNFKCGWLNQNDNDGKEICPITQDEWNNLACVIVGMKFSAKCTSSDTIDRSTYVDVVVEKTPGSSNDIQVRLGAMLIGYPSYTTAMTGVSDPLSSTNRKKLDVRYPGIMADAKFTFGYSENGRTGQGYIGIKSYSVNMAAYTDTSTGTSNGRRWLETLYEYKNNTDNTNVSGTRTYNTSNNEAQTENYTDQRFTYTVDYMTLVFNSQ